MAKIEGNEPGPEWNDSGYTCQIWWRDKEVDSYILIDYFNCNNIDTGLKWLQTPLDHVDTSEIGDLFEKRIIYLGTCDVAAFRRFKIEVHEKLIEMEVKI